MDTGSMLWNGHTRATGILSPSHFSLLSFLQWSSFLLFALFRFLFFSCSMHAHMSSLSSKQICLYMLGFLVWGFFYNSWYVCHSGMAKYSILE